MGYDFRDITQSAVNGVSITANTALAEICRGVYIGKTQSLDFCFNGTDWVTFPVCIAGNIMQLRVVGARKTTGTAAPDAGDVVFLY